MVRFVLKRLLFLIPCLLGVSFIIFALMEMAPGDPVYALLGDLEASEEAIAALRAQLGLDRPMIVRYGRYMFRLIQGDLGVSDITGICVWSMFIERLPNTLALAFGGLVIGVAVSIPMGIFAAKRAGKAADNLTTAFSLVGISMPSFWVALLLILLFSYHLGWLPAGAMRHGWRSFVLPSISSSLMLMAFSVRQTRSSVLEVLRADYLRTARAKGVPENAVIKKHALGNALIPIVTTIGMSFSAALAGSAVVEAVFAWPGIGRMVVDAVFARDVTKTTGTVIMTTAMYVIVLLIVDVLYAIIDPRIKAQYVTKKRRASAPAHANAKALDAFSATEGNEPGEILPPESEKPEEILLEPILQTASVQTNVSAAHAPVKAATAAVVVDAPPDNAVSFVTRERIEDVKMPSGAEDISRSDKGVELTELATKRYRKRSQFGEILHHLSKNKGAMAGLIILAALILTFLISLWTVSFEAVTAAAPLDRFSPPSRQYLFGTDGMGRDQFLRVIYGIRYSLAIGFSATGIAASFGVFFGVIAGFYGKLADEIIMRISDVFHAIPTILLGMVIVATLGQSLTNLVIAVGVPVIPVFIRITRASVLSIRGNEYVEAAQAIGLSRFRIAFTQVLPNGLAPVIITFTTSLGMAILLSASLSFLGFGIPVPHPEWGQLISGGRNFIRIAPWLTVFPGLFMMVTVLAFNLLGDGLRDALDPKLKK